MNKTNQSLFKSLLFAVFAVVFMYILAVTPISTYIRSIFHSTNLPAMFLSIMVYLVILIMTRKIDVKLPGSLIKTGFIFAALFLLISFVMERDVFAALGCLDIEMSLPQPVVFLLTILLCTSAFYLSKKIREIKIVNHNNRPGIHIVIGILVFILVGLSAYHQYYMNYSYAYDYHHLHAYYNSILNIFWNQPYTETFTSVYGHYAFFYYPILKLAYHFGIHNIFKTFTLINCILLAITLLIWIRILLWNVKRPLFQIMGILFICHLTAARISGIYHQNYPHRAFPIAVSALLIALWFKNHGKQKNHITIIGYLAGILFMIWNLEYGFFAVVSWAALHICSEFQSKPAKWYVILLHCFLIPFVFISAYLLCGVINKYGFGGEILTIQDFVFPLLSSNYMQDTLEHNLPSFPSAWMSIMVLLLFFLGYGIKDTFLCTDKPEKSDQTAVCFSIAVLGLGSVSYAINRPAYLNFSIILPLAGVLIAIIADRFYDTNFFGKKNDISSFLILKRLSGFLAFCVLVVMAVSTIINIPYKYEKFRFYKNTDKIDLIYGWFQQINNPEALAIGGPASIAYSYFGWDPGIYYMDISDIGVIPEAKEELIEKLKNLDHQSVYLTNDVSDMINLVPEEFWNTHTLFSSVNIEDIRMEYWHGD